MANQIFASNANVSILQLACKIQLVTLVGIYSSAMAWDEDNEPCQHRLAYFYEGHRLHKYVIITDGSKSVAITGSVGLKKIRDNHRWK